MDKKLLEELCNLDGVSGREGTVSAYILEQIASLKTPHEVSVDAMGNILLHLIGKQTPSKKLLIDAHMDEVGFLISHITDEGYLRFETVGSIDKSALFGARVRIGDRVGVIAGKAMHHCSAEEAGKIPDVDSMLIDIGACNREEAERVVRVGQAGTFDSRLTFFNQSSLFMGKAVDDRVGCALLLTLAQSQPTYDVWFSFSVQEEVGLRGAATVANAVKPDVAVAIDATTAQDTAGSTDETCVCRVGNGAVVSFADKATVYDYDLYQSIRDIAREIGVSTQTKNRVAGGNNAGAIQRANNGARMAAVSLPTRYIHSSRCVGKWEDVLAMEALLHELVERLPQ